MGGKNGRRGKGNGGPDVWSGERTRRREGRSKKTKVGEIGGREEVGDLF